MRVNKIVCDKCGVEIKENPNKVFIEQANRGSGKILNKHCDLTDHLDFCDMCKMEIVGYLCNAKSIRVQETEEPPSQTPDPEPAKVESAPEPLQEPINEPDEIDVLVEKLNEPGETYPAQKEAVKRNKLDLAKVMVLHKAGWNNKKIAEEFHTTPGTISVAICNYKKKHQ